MAINRSELLQFRSRPDEAVWIRAAATASHRSFSEFARATLLTEARRILADDSSPPQHQGWSLGREEGT